MSNAPRLHRLLVLAAGFATGCGSPAPDPGDYRIVDTSSTNPTADLEATVLTIQLGDNPNNRFTIHHVRSPLNVDTSHPVVLLPPVTNGFDFYEVGQGGDYGLSLTGHLARAGFDIWGYTTRAQSLPDGACEATGSDCSIAADWGLQSIVDDTAFIRTQIAGAPSAPTANVHAIVGGVSLGSIAAAAVINSAPNDYAGAFLIEGSEYSDDPEVRQINQQFCSAIDSTLLAGVAIDSQTLPSFRGLALLSKVAPDDPSPSPKFNGLSNRQAFVAALSSAQLSPLQPLLDFFILAGDVKGGTFTYADEDMVQAALASLPMYAAVRLLGDINCGLSGDRTFTANLPSFRGSIFDEQDGHGFGPSVGSLVDVTSAASITRVLHPTYGHYDSVFAPTREDDWAMLSSWMLDVFTQSSTSARR